LARDLVSDGERLIFICTPATAGFFVLRQRKPRQGRPCMVISTTQSSKIELADWLGVIGTTRRRETCFSKN
jgi:hypothetical protein